MGQATTGTISGVVRDATAAVIPGATVTVTNVDTGISRSLSTGAQGRFNAPNLLPGNYEVQAQVAGFQTEVRSGITLSVGREAVVNFTLQVGDVTQSVEVTGEAPMVNTTNAAITGMVEEEAIENLPLNGRSFDQLVLLQVGTALARRAGSGGGLTAAGAKITIAGARPQQNSFLLDGTDVNGPVSTMPGGAADLFLGGDTIREFRVLTNAYSAEFGRSSGGVITAVTRSGTNSFHGTAFEFHRNDDLDARNFYDRELPPFVRNQFGFTLGGPIKKNRTFFFGSYEGLRDRLGQTRSISVPTAAARQGILPGRAPITVAEAVKPWLNLYPLPNGRDFNDGTAEHVFSDSRLIDQNYISGRVDHTFSSNHSIFGRYTFDDGIKGEPENYPTSSTSLDSRNQYTTLEMASIVSPTTINAFRAAYNRTFLLEETVFDGGFPLQSFSPGVPFEFGGLLNVSGLVAIGVQRAPRGWTYHTFQWSDDVTHTRGKHTLKMGGIVQRVRMNMFSLNGRAGVYSFTGGLASFLQGNANRFLVEPPGQEVIRGWRETLVGFYIQDDYRVSQNLTLNLGVREEFMTSPKEVNGRASNMPIGGFTPTIDYVVGNPLFETFKFNLAPRVGFAWDTRGNAKAVLRGGFGLFYDQPFPTYFKGASNVGPPFGGSTQVDNPPFPNAFDTLDLSDVRFGDGRPLNYTGTTYAMQYNLTLQSEIAPGWGATLGYAGSQGRKLWRTGNGNIKIPTILSDGTTQCFNTARGARNPFCPDGARSRRNPNFSGMRMQHTDANSNYNSLIASLEKRMTRGLRFQFSYTYSKILSDAESVFGSDFVSGGEHQLMDPYNPRLDRGIAGFSLKHNFVFNYSYEFPLALEGAAGKLMNGWQISGVTSLTSGAPHPVMSEWGSDNGSTGSSITERPNLVAGKTNNPVEGTTSGCGTFQAGQKLGGPDLYFDPCNFEIGPKGFYGNLGRNTVIGPGLATVDFSLIKNTRITEGTNLQFRAEFFNLFNRANFGTPETFAFNSSGVRYGNTGRITSTSTSSRQIQFGLKVTF